MTDKLKWFVENAQIERRIYEIMPIAQRKVPPGNREGRIHRSEAWDVGDTKSMEASTIGGIEDEIKGMRGRRSAIRYGGC